MTQASGTSYLDLSLGGPNAIVELMPGVRSLFDYVALTAGERVLIFHDHTADPLVIQALAAGAAMLGAEVNLLSVDPFVPGGWREMGPSPLLVAAYAEADVVVSCVWQAEVQTRELFFTQAKRFRARFISLQMTGTASMLATGVRFPLDLYLRIVGRAMTLFQDVRSLRVTTRTGTDLTFQQPSFVPEPGRLKPGTWRPVPYGGLNFYNQVTDGVFVVEESNVTGVPEEPLSIVVRGGMVTEIRGGAAAEQLRRFGPMGYYMRHFYIGMNPKVRLMGAPQFERTKHAGAFYLGLDGLTDGKPDREVPGYAHCDFVFDRPTITVDGRTVVEAGHLLLLDDRGVREDAAAFGDPDILLDDNPNLVLPARLIRSMQAGAPA